MPAAFMLYTPAFCYTILRLFHIDSVLPECCSVYVDMC